MSRPLRHLSPVLALVAIAAPSSPSTFLATPPEELARRADAVVEARVVSVRSFWNAGRTAILTEARLAVDEVVAGTAPPRLVVRTFGGTVGDVTLEVDGFPRFTSGERQLVFLANEPADGSLRVLGYRQGQYRIHRGDDGTELAVSSGAVTQPLLDLKRRIAAGLAFAEASAGAEYVLLSPQRTWDGPPDYVVDSGGMPSVNDGDGGATRVVNAITAAVSWNGAGSGTVIRAHKGSVAGFAAGDGVPMVLFSDPLAACTNSCLAATLTTYHAIRGGGSYEILDADVVTNRNGHAWTSQGEDPSGLGCSSEVYVESVMTHEIGHGLGLAHSPTSGSTMQSSVAYCSNVAATTETDDEAGLRWLYGTAPCVGCAVHTDYLTGPGAVRYEPFDSYYWSPAGTQSGWLVGDSESDFDLHLWKWVGSTWTLVASSAGSSSPEAIDYPGTSGYYVWQATSYSGAGQYHFWLRRP